MLSLYQPMPEQNLACRLAVLYGDDFVPTAVISHRCSGIYH